jgi:hypothetical protein
MPHLLHYQHGGVLIDGLIDRRHDAHAHHDLDDLGRLDRHLLGQLPDHDRRRDRDFVHDGRGRHLKTVSPRRHDLAGSHLWLRPTPAALVAGDM